MNAPKPKRPKDFARRHRLKLRRKDARPKKPRQSPLRRERKKLRPRRRLESRLPWALRAKTRIC